MQESVSLHELRPQQPWECPVWVGMAIQLILTCTSLRKPYHEKVNFRSGVGVLC